MSDKVAVENLFKIFGDDPDQALELLKQGKDKDEILDETGMTVGVQDTSFSVKEGEIFVVMGLSGSGKSTLIRMLNRLIEPTSGAVKIDDKDITQMSGEELRQIRLKQMSMVFQHFALFPHMTVAENVAYGLKVRGVSADERREKALNALEQVGLRAWGDRPPSDLSGGMQQRVGLARGLAVDPEILLMDEPFSALDPLIRRDMQGELLELQREVHKTIVFITHDLNEALILGDRIAIMKEGKFVQVGTPQEIVADPADDYVRAFTEDVDRSRVFTAETVMKDPETVSLSDTSAKQAAKRMEELDRHGIYVTKNGDIAGVLRYSDCVDSQGTNGTDVSDILITDYPKTEPDTHLFEVYRQCAKGVPIAVMKDGDFVGVVEPLHVFEALSGGDEERTKEAAEKIAAEAAEA
ncbi:MAG: glycine betaine/L-proline ABC transporter ATP-binding protein [Rhodovibrionaceae bacterium]|nr:glycine betaine/L-proline ABC transporter ATP-binding protein [Rhodovibrionaceae bacterium]